MGNNFKHLLVVFFLLISVGLIFAEEGYDWITFNKENKQITPIIFGRINIDNPDFSFCTVPFSETLFKPNLSGGETPITNTAILANGDRSVNFFLRNTSGRDPQKLVAKDFITPYYVSTSFCNNSSSGESQLQLLFTFKQAS